MGETKAKAKAKAGLLTEALERAELNKDYSELDMSKVHSVYPALDRRGKF